MPLRRLAPGRQPPWEPPGAPGGPGLCPEPGLSGRDPDTHSPDTAAACSSAFWNFSHFTFENVAAICFLRPFHCSLYVF